MAQSAYALGPRAVERERTRARVRRSRRLAALGVLLAAVLVTLGLAALGSSAQPSASPSGPAPADRLLPAGPPRAQVVAMQGGLSLLLPINQRRVTAIGYHASVGTLSLEPIGRQANAGLIARLIRSVFGGGSGTLSYVSVGGGQGSELGALEVGAPWGTDVYAPVDGTVIAVADQVIDGRIVASRIEIQPNASPGVVVTLTNLELDPALTVGSSVSAPRSRIGRVADLSTVQESALARYTQDSGQHLQIEVRPAMSLAAA